MTSVSPVPPMPDAAEAPMTRRYVAVVVVEVVVLLGLWLLQRAFS